MNEIPSGCVDKEVNFARQGKNIKDFFITFHDTRGLFVIYELIEIYCSGPVRYCTDTSSHHLAFAAKCKT